MELKTPIFETKLFKDVYEPSEDTFLLIDALEQEIENLTQLKPLFVAEIGSGFGIVITALSKFLNSLCFCCATDINFEANKATNHTAKLNNASVDSVNTNFLSCFLNNIFDVVIFNPPYVVTESNEIKGRGLSRSWAGGKFGREIIDDFLKIIPIILSPNGVCYMVAIRENKIDDIKKILNQINFSCVIIKERKILGEHLYVLKITKF